MTYLPFVDGLRAVAILAVVAYHALPWALPGGFAGVDVFFVISGFLITRFIAAEIADGTFSLARFYVRRARRLMPAALVCFVIVTALSAFVLLPDTYWFFGRSLLAAILMYANVFFYNTGGYFSAPSLEKPLLHTWSLSVEDQFYLTWPLLLLFLWPRVSRRTLWFIGAGMLAASFAYSEYMLVKDPEFAFFQLPTRAWELLIGALIALAATSFAMPKMMAEALAAAGGAAVLLSFAVLTPDSHFPGLGALPACVGTAAIIAAGLHQPTLVGRALSLKPVVFVGLISYSLYLWHWPLISLLSYRLERPLSVTEAAVVVALSFIIAVLSWRYIERPFRARHVASGDVATVLPAADRNFVFAALAGALVVVGIAGALKIGKGFPQRFDAHVRTALDQMVAGNPLRGSCDNYQNIFRNDDVCNFGRKKAASESYEVALFGDSMADHWAPLVAALAAEKNLAGRQVTNGGCGLLFGISIPAWPVSKTPECDLYQQEAEKFIAANPGLKLAVISGFWEKWVGRVEHVEQLRDVPLPRSAAEANGLSSPRFDKVLADTIEVFTRRGVKVLLVGQIPTYGVLPVRCVVAKLRNGEDAETCGMTRAESDKKVKRSDAALLRVANGRADVSVTLPSGYMCRATRCAPIMDGTFLYANTGHVNQSGALAMRKFIGFPSLP
ncbi:MAG: acyltransferase family protein [Hyphomicrobium sp.]